MVTATWLMSPFCTVGALAAVPAQFIAKQFTEALGRIPNPAEWQAWVNYFGTNGCSIATLKTARTLYLSREYLSGVREPVVPNGLPLPPHRRAEHADDSRLALDNAAKVLTLYRGLLNREPDADGYRNLLAGLNDGESWAKFVDSFINSGEFESLAERICSGIPYYFGGNPAIGIPVSGDGFQGGNGDELQALLNQAAPGSTIWLAQKSITRLTDTLVIPPGVTLSTTGLPTPRRYALMGRVVRGSNFDHAAVQLQPGAKLVSVWVDGQRGTVGFGGDKLNIHLNGGEGTTVMDSVSSNTAGGGSVLAEGTEPCRNNMIVRNLITDYNSDHYDGTWSDGLRIACEDVLATENQIVDATDGGIVVFRVFPGMDRQHSIVRNNMILSAGNSAYGGLIFDPLFPGAGYPAPDFSGASFMDNTLWSGPATHFDIVLSVGTQGWFHDLGGFVGNGASAIGNTSGGLTIRCNAGIAIDGMLNATVFGNLFQTKLIKLSPCPSVAVGADMLNGHASGVLQTNVQTVFHSCIGH